MVFTTKPTPPYLKDSLNPGHDLVAAGVARLIKVAHSVGKVLCKGTLHRALASLGEGCVMAGTDVQFVDPFEQHRPLVAVQLRTRLIGSDDEVCASVHLLEVFCHFFFCVYSFLKVPTKEKTV